MQNSILKYSRFDSSSGSFSFACLVLHPLDADLPKCEAVLHNTRPVMVQV